MNFRVPEIKLGVIKNMTKDKKTFISAEVSIELARKATIAAAHTGISRSVLIRNAIEQYIERLNLPGLELDKAVNNDLPQAA
jgi:predicted DNA-binding protein